ncbi:MAG: hypothetical protein JRC87_02390 [Deltaproteobacteria bacterium]|nr:hypothetical protein [Deltaproteobacteria bacterium]
MKPAIPRKIRGNSDDNGAREKLSHFLASAPVLLSALSIICAGGLLLTKPENGSLLMTIKSYAPALLLLAGSFLGGLLVGRAARNTLRPIILTAGIIIAAVTLLTKFGVLDSSVDMWVQSTVGWISDNMDKTQGYIATLLPSSTAAGSGFFIGFRRRKKLREKG